MRIYLGDRILTCISANAPANTIHISRHTQTHADTRRQAHFSRQTPRLEPMESLLTPTVLPLLPSFLSLRAFFVRPHVGLLVSWTAPRPCRLVCVNQA